MPGWKGFGKRGCPGIALAFVALTRHCESVDLRRLLLGRVSFVIPIWLTYALMWLGVSFILYLPMGGLDWRAYFLVVGSAVIVAVWTWRRSAVGLVPSSSSGAAQASTSPRRIA